MWGRPMEVSEKINAYTQIAMSKDALLYLVAVRKLEEIK